MGYELRSGFPRAYVALPVCPEDGLKRALQWCFRQGRTVMWDSIGILVPAPDMIEDTPVIRRFRTRGLTVAAPRQMPADAVSMGGFTGPLVAYCPDPPTLALAEDVSGARGLVAVSSNNDWLSSWVATHRPERLGGALL